MLKISFDENVSKKLLKIIREAPDRIEGAISTALLRSGNEMRNKAIKLAPFKSGNLRRSITIRSGRRVVRVGTNVVYARIHDQGGSIRAHTITPRNGKFLRFVTKGGRVVFARKVRKPARFQKKYKGRGFLTPAFREQADGKAQKIFSEEINAVLN